MFDRGGFDGIEEAIFGEDAKANSSFAIAPARGSGVHLFQETPVSGTSTTIMSLSRSDPAQVCR